MSSWVETRHLRYFLAVAETENFTRAAERLAITQPSISQQIKEFENRIGTPLFTRVGKRVRLTEAGAVFREHAEVVLRKLDQACEAVANVTGLVTGHVDIGVIPALHLAWIPEVLGRLAREYPGLTVSVREEASGLIETEIEAGRMDLGLGLMSHMSPNIRYQRLLTEKLALIVPPDHAFAGRRTLALRELQTVRLVLLPESFDMRRAVDGIFRKAKLRPTVAFENGTIDSTLKTVVHAGTPTVLPPIVLRGREALGLRAIHFSDAFRPLEFGMLTPKGGETGATARVIVELLREFIVAPRGRASGQRS